jgi:3-hydroxyacyl-[acyl-carrier-protein] dehydratase
MPLPLVDLDSLDLSRTILVREDLERFLKQRRTFAAVDGVLHFDEEGEFIVGYKDVRSDDWWTSDHIPGRPIYPGMLMVEGAAQLGSFDFCKRHPQGSDPFIGFVGIDRTRFRGVVEPDCRLILVCKVDRVRGGRFTYRCQGLVEGKLVFESLVTGMQI